MSIDNTKIRLVWHRRDLRLHDNDLYANLEETGTQVLSLFVFDDADFHPMPSTSRPRDWASVRVGPHSGRILNESLADLRRSLRHRGGELLVRVGHTPSIIGDLVLKLGASQVVWHEEPGYYETLLSNDVKASLQKQCGDGVKIQTSMQYTLYHTDDLPLGGPEWQACAHPKNARSRRKKNQPQSEGRSRTSNRWNGMPRIMGDFRKAARAKTKPRPCFEAPTKLTAPETDLVPGTIPSLESLYQPLIDSRTPILGFSTLVVGRVLRHAAQPQRRHGGETVALAHLADFCSHHASTAVRNLACVDDHQSSRLSHSLAWGCLSPRRVVQEAERWGEGCRWIISHMTMRDFFLYTCLANGPAFYQREGIPVHRTKTKQSEEKSWEDWTDDVTLRKWEQWAWGETGLPLVDAAMKELLQTGYCSNRVRQNVASLLAKDLRLDWRAGAEWFQFLLGDHCVGANWGNWLYFSGVGPDPKERHFRTISQALKYDCEGKYVKQWIPSLKELDGDEAFLRPWDYTNEWKAPIVPPNTQYVWQDLQMLRETGKIRPYEGTIDSTK